MSTLTSAPDTDDATLSESISSFGSEVRQVRRARQMTLRDLAEASGISVSHLSAIERGAVNASLNKVAQIAEALGVSADWFFAKRAGAGPMERAYVVRARNRRNLNQLYGEDVDELGLSDKLLSSSIGGAFFMGVAEYAPHSARPNHPMYQHGGEQHGFVLEGELELVIGGEEIRLQAGDSYSFPTEIIHNARNRTGKPCRLVWAISPVVIPRDVVIEAHSAGEAEERRPATRTATG